MIKSIKHLFHNNDHKVIMLRSLFVLFIIIYAVLAIVAYILGLYDIFWVKLGVGLLIVLLFLSCLKFRNIPLITILFIIVLEIDTSLGMLSKDFYDFVAIYPFLIILGFFFFFRLKTALLMTVVHFAYWIVMTILRYHLIADHPMFQSLMSDINMFTTSVVVVFLGLFYNLSTEITYEKLEASEKKHKTLLKEIHHRIKNNLNIIASIFGLQILNLKKGFSKSPEEVLKDNKMRIEAIAMIHESLYKNHDLSRVPFKEYGRNLTGLINQTYNRNIAVEIDSKNISMPLEKMFRLGIILNELFTNSIKYAFEHDKSSDQVKIMLYQQGDNYYFIYHESHNEHIDIDKMLNSKTLGIRLIQLTVKQMEGTLDISLNDGLRFTIVFKA